METKPDAKHAWDAGLIKTVGLVKFYGLKKGKVLDCTKLWELLRAAEKAHPWVRSKTSAESPPTIEPKGRDSEETLTFTVAPHYNLHARHLYPFHRYLCGMAELVAQQGLTEVGQVSVCMEMSSDKTDYLTPAGIRFRNEVGEIAKGLFKLPDGASL